MAVIFRDFLTYQLSARDNIALRPHEREDDRAGLEATAPAAGAPDA